MDVLCEDREHGGCDGPVRAYVIEGGRGRIAPLCECHRESRTNVAVRDWGDLVFPDARTAEIVALYRAYHDARTAFAQRYDEGAVCALVAQGGCDGGVASYYFSDGGTLPLCRAHLEDAPTVGDDGIPMSVQYHDEVYEKSHDALFDAWRSWLGESRAAAQAAKR